MSWTPLLPLAVQLQLKVSKQKREIMKAMAIKRRKGLENRKRRLKRRHSSKISLVWPEFQEVQPSRKRGCAFTFHVPNNYLSLKMPIYLGRLTWLNVSGPFIAPTFSHFRSTEIQFEKHFSTPDLFQISQTNSKLTSFPHLRSVKSYFPVLCSNLTSHLLLNLLLWNLKAPDNCTPNPCSSDPPNSPHQESLEPQFQISDNSPRRPGV